MKNLKQKLIEEKERSENSQKNLQGVIDALNNTANRDIPESSSASTTELVQEAVAATNTSQPFTVPAWLERLILLLPVPAREPAPPDYHTYYDIPEFGHRDDPDAFVTQTPVGPALNTPTPTPAPGPWVPGKEWLWPATTSWQEGLLTKREKRPR